MCVCVRVCVCERACVCTFTLTHPNPHLPSHTELTSGLSVLCGGDRDEKVSAAFALFDVNGDGYISKDEMVTYLVSVFKLLYATQVRACMYVYP